MPPGTEHIHFEENKNQSFSGKAGRCPISLRAYTVITFQRTNACPRASCHLILCQFIEPEQGNACCAALWHTPCLALEKTYPVYTTLYHTMFREVGAEGLSAMPSTLGFHPKLNALCERGQRQGPGGKGKKGYGQIGIETTFRTLGRS